MMTAPRSLFADNILGSDDLYDGTSATIDAVNGHGPYKTLTKALSQTAKYNLSGYTFHIYLADGTYPETWRIEAPSPNGSGIIFIHGNSANPNMVRLINSGIGSCLRVFDGTYIIDGLSFQAGGPGDAPDPQIDLWVSGSGICWLYSVAFAYANGGHLLSGSGGQANIVGPVYVTGGTGAGYAHMTSGGNASINIWGFPLPTLNLLANISVGQWVNGNNGAFMGAQYAAMNMNGFSVTGQKFVASSNAIIDSGGRGDAYLPGNVAGARYTGGQYV
jgi:hypothetical protein